MKSNTTMTLPTSTSRTTYEITKELNKIADMNMSNGRWMAIPGKEKEVNALLYEMNLAQKQQDLKNEGDITKGEQWGAATVMSILEGLESWDTGTQIAVHKALGQDVPDYLMADSALQVDNARKLEDVGIGMKLISDVSKATGNMLPTMTIGLVFPQAELKAIGKFAQLVGKAVTSTSLFASSFGNNYKQAIREGRPEDEAVSYALLNAASETTMEQLIGIVGGNRLSNWAGKKIAPYVDDVISAVAKNPAVKKKLYDYASAFTGEALEEFLQSVMQPVFENIAYSGEDYTFKNNPVTVTLDNVYDGLVGGIMGSVFESVGMVPKDSAVDTDTDIQTKTDTNTKPSVNDKSTSNGKGTSLFDKATQKNLEKLSEADAIAADAEVTNAYAEHLKSEGVSSEAAANFVKQSAMSRTSKASAIEHTLKVMSEYGAAIKAKVEKIVSKGKTQSTDPNIANSDQVSIGRSEKLQTTKPNTLDTMTDTQVDTLYKTTVNEYADMLRAADFSEVQIESYLDEAMKTTGVENQKSAIVKLQEEMGNGNALNPEPNDATIALNSLTQNPKSNEAVLEALPQEHHEIFAEGKLTHVLVGEVVNGQAKGFHYEGMPEQRGSIIQGSLQPIDQNNVYRADVEIDGIRKEDQSTFFPKTWTPLEVTQAVYEAYQSKKLFRNKKYKYSGETKSGIAIIMYLDNDGKITSAYPKYVGGNQ